MIHCSACGKAIDKVPDWLAGVQVEFICNNCPNRHTQNIAFIKLETEAPPTAKLEEDEVEPDEVADPAE